MIKRNERELAVLKKAFFIYCHGFLDGQLFPLARIKYRLDDLRRTKFLSHYAPDLIDSEFDNTLKQWGEEFIKERNDE
jgi:hypothetical protein